MQYIWEYLDLDMNQLENKQRGDYLGHVQRVGETRRHAVQICRTPLAQAEFLQPRRLVRLRAERVLPGQSNNSPVGGNAAGRRRRPGSFAGEDCQEDDGQYKLASKGCLVILVCSWFCEIHSKINIGPNNFKLILLDLSCDALHLKNMNPCYCPVFLSIDLFVLGCLNVY